MWASVKVQNPCLLGSIDTRIHTHLEAESLEERSLQES